MTTFFPSDQKAVMDEVGRDGLHAILREMLLIRNVEQRAEAAYQQGLIGGFFHAYSGQEAIQASCVHAIGTDNWFAATYRCHALALLLGVSPRELMAELYGRAAGNAKGRGGSMHLYTDRLLGGFGIVGGQIPVGTGAAFSLKYQGDKERIAVCFLGDGAVAQGSFHESLNLASLWSLPCMYVIENNRWGMGTAVKRAICVERLAEDKAPGYAMKGYTFDGMDFFNCYAGFRHVRQEILSEGRPVLVEVLTQRFRGHSISDPGLYRTKEELEKARERDPLLLLKTALLQAGFLSEEEYKAIDKECRDVAIDAMKYAEECPWPDPVTLEQDVLAP